jgi:hypothetical protein
MKTLRALSLLAAAFATLPMLWYTLGGNAYRFETSIWISAFLVCVAICLAANFITSKE